MTVNWQPHTGHWRFQTGWIWLVDLIDLHAKTVVHMPKICSLKYKCARRISDISDVILIMQSNDETVHKCSWGTPDPWRRSDGNRACGGEFNSSSSALLDQGQVLNHSIPSASCYPQNATVWRLQGSSHIWSQHSGYKVGGDRSDQMLLDHLAVVHPSITGGTEKFQKYTLGLWTLQIWTMMSQLSFFCEWFRVRHWLTAGELQVANVQKNSCIDAFNGTWCTSH